MHKLGVVMYDCNPSTNEVGAEGAEIQGHLLLHSEFEASWGYMRPCLGVGIKGWGQ